MSWTSSPIVPLGLATSRSGASPILCIPGAGASVTSFLDFAGAIGERYPIYGLQPKGLDLLEEPDTSVEAASLRYLDAMRHEYIVGPVHLIGHSHGGRVAFDMALRLVASGSPVRSLTLVDTRAPEYEDDVWNVPADADMFREFVHVFERSFSVGLHVPDVHLGGASVQSFVNALHAELVRTRCLSARTSSDPVLGSLLTFMAARRHPYRAGKSYAGCVKLVLVGSHDEAEALSVDRHVALLAGWRRVAAKTDTWTGTGDHFSVLHVPHVMAMAAWWLRESVCAIDTEPA